MDWQQASQMITWLDEEHRRDRTKLAELEFKTESQATETAELARRVQEQGEKLGQLGGELARLGQLGEALERVRDELTMLINQVDERRRQGEEALARARKDEWSAHNQAIAGLSARLDGLSRLEERINSLRSENERAMTALQNLHQRLPELSQRIDSQTSRVPYLEERARQDSRRLGELQEGLEEVIKRSQAQNPKLIAIDERVARSEQQIHRLVGLGEDLKEEYRDLAEQMRLADRERAQQMAQWRQDMEGHSAEMRRYSQRQEQLLEHLGEARQVLNELTDLKERLIQEQRLVGERQRVAEEAMRKEQQRWQTENSSIWMKHDLEWRNRLEEWETSSQRILERFGQMEDWRREEMELLRELRELITQERQERQEWLAGLWEVQKEFGERRVTDMRNWVEQLKERADRWLEAEGG